MMDVNRWTGGRVVLKSGESSGIVRHTLYVKTIQRPFWWRVRSQTIVRLRLWWRANVYWRRFVP